MKSKIIKRIAGISAIGLAGVLFTGTILNSVMSVQAEETLFGIESLIQEVQNRDNPYRILEIVPDEKAAEIGYYIPGYEPVLSTREAGSGAWTGWLDGLRELKTQEERQEYMAALGQELEQFMSLRGFTAGNTPVSYQGYAESDEPRDGYKELTFEADVLKGYFRAYTGGDVPRYDIKIVYAGAYNDANVTANAPMQFYYVDNATMLTAENSVDLPDDTELYRYIDQANRERFEIAGTWGDMKDTIEFPTVSDGDASVSGGDTSVSGSDAVDGSGGDGDDTTDEDVEWVDYFQIELQPWTQDISPAYPALYAVESFEKNEAGHFEFVETDTGYDTAFYTDAIYYKGGFASNEWFHTAVLNRLLGETAVFPVEVITLTVAELNAMAEVPAFDMLYVNSGKQGFVDGGSIVPYSANNDISASMCTRLFTDVITSIKPCIVDASLVYSVDSAGIVSYDATYQSTQMYRLAAMFMQETPAKYCSDVVLNGTISSVDQLQAGFPNDADKNYVIENIYTFCAPMSLVSPEFDVDAMYKDAQEVHAVRAEGFGIVLDEILSENMNREADASGAYGQLPTDVSQATAVRHILNYKNRREIEVKKNLRVLEIQPAKSVTDDLTEAEVKKWAPNVDTVEIVTMTTAEFIGKIEDINEKYDLIYIGTDKDYMNLDSGVASGTGVGKTVFNDSTMDGLIYFHTGDMRYTTMDLAGLLDSEYVSGKDGRLSGHMYYYNPVRYGGNDITEEKKRALLSFLEASYPIVISDEVFKSAVTIYEDGNYGGFSVDLAPGRYTTANLKALGMADNSISSLRVSSGYQITLYNYDNFSGSSTYSSQTDVSQLPTSYTNRWNDRTSSLVITEIDGQEDKRVTEIDTNHIDNSSYMYDFIKEAMGKSNFYQRSKIVPDSHMFQFYLNRPKVNLVNVYANGAAYTDDVQDLYPAANGKYTLEYKFTIQNEGAASADTRYRCDLYIDVNADGKFSLDERMRDVGLTQNEATVASDQLYINREYTLRRVVPDGYKGVLPWKIQISQVNNTHIHNGVIGYTKLRGLDSENLKILQICREPYNWEYDARPDPEFNLEARIANPNDIYHVLIYGGTYDNVRYPGISQDFTIDVDFLFLGEFEEAYAENNDLLDDYNMLILGFSDIYGNISGTYESGPISSIVDFMERGKSVLFAHDTVFSINYLNQYPDGSSPRRARTNRSSSTLTDGPKYYDGYNVTQHIRGLVGMDRYGVMEYDALRTGQGLTPSSTIWNEVINNKELAYIPKSNKAQTTGLTHGYTYPVINLKDVVNNGGRNETFSASWTLEGQAFTNQYANLNYGTVYYTDNTYDNGELSTDANNTFEVTNLSVTQVNRGQITDYPYKLSETFKVSNTHAQYYQLDFMEDADEDKQSDLVVWYCLGNRTNSRGTVQETIYSASPNDVSNNYYIYSKGNITYTGVGHAGNASTVDEAKLFINTMIASYNSGIKDPIVTTLSDGSANATESTSADIYFDEVNDLSFDSSENENPGSEGKKRIYFTVNDVNFVRGERTIGAKFYYDSNAGDAQTISYGGKSYSVKELPVEIYKASDNSRVDDAGRLESGVNYYILFDDDILEDFESRLSVHIEVQTTITTKSTITNKEYVTSTGKAYCKFDYTKVQLFDLE